MTLERLDANGSPGLLVPVKARPGRLRLEEYRTHARHRALHETPITEMVDRCETSAGGFERNVAAPSRADLPARAAGVCDGRTALKLIFLGRYRMAAVAKETYLSVPGPVTYRHSPAPSLRLAHQIRPHGDR
jgi:hypothetical protein